VAHPVDSGASKNVYDCVSGLGCRRGNAALHGGQDVAHHISADFHDAIRNEIADQFKQHDTSKDLQQLQNDVAEIKGKLSILAPFIQELTRKRLEETKKLSAESLKSRLPELKNLVSLAQQEQVKVNPAVMRDVSKELLAVQPRSPEFWQLSAALISYRSSLN
jgi:hypothetical protein